MCRRPKEMLLQRRNTDGQQAHTKMLTITNHQENVNQNHNEISPHICPMTIVKKKKDKK